MLSEYAVLSAVSKQQGAKQLKGVLQFISAYKPFAWLREVKIKAANIHHELCIRKLDAVINGSLSLQTVFTRDISVKTITLYRTSDVTKDYTF